MTGYDSAQGDEIKQLFAILKKFAARLAELERPTGTQTAGLVKQLFDIVNGITEATEISVSGNITSTGGNVSAGGAIAAGGNITSTGGSITTNSGFFFSPAGYSYDITYPRIDAWMGNDGRIAWASSSREKKTDIEDAGIDPLAVLQISARVFHYKAEIAKRDDPDYPEYVGPEYHVADEFGAIAEELHELGLWQVVVYKDHVTPISIHYSLLGLLAIEASKHIWNQHLALAVEVAAIKQHLGI